MGPDLLSLPPSPRRRVSQGPDCDTGWAYNGSNTRGAGGMPMVQGPTAAYNGAASGGSLPPSSTTEGTGLRIRAWDPAQDERGLWNAAHVDHAHNGVGAGGKEQWGPGLDLDARLSPLSGSGASFSDDPTDPVTTNSASNSPVSELESSLSSLFLDGAAPGVHHGVPQGGQGPAGPPPPPPGMMPDNFSVVGSDCVSRPQVRRYHQYAPPHPHFRQSTPPLHPPPSPAYHMMQPMEDAMAQPPPPPHLRLNLSHMNSMHGMSSRPPMPSPSARGGLPLSSPSAAAAAAAAGRLSPHPSMTNLTAASAAGAYGMPMVSSPRYSPRYVSNLSPHHHHHQHHHHNPHQLPQHYPSTAGLMGPVALGGSRLPSRVSMMADPMRRRAAGLRVNVGVGAYSPSGLASPLGMDEYGGIMSSPYGSGYGSGAPSPVGLGGLGLGMASAIEQETKRCSNAIKKLCSAGNISEVFTVLEDMLSRGLAPDLKTVKTVMRTCVKKLAWRRALQLLHTPGLPLDVVVYTMAINTCGKAGEWEQGLRVLREMDEASLRDPSLTPNEVSYGTAISACGKAGRWELALMLLNEVKDRGLVLNDVCYGGAIDACGRAGQWQEALKLLHEMTVEGVAPNEVCYNSAISACGKAGEWEKAVALLREMRERGLTPDELNYNSAISACGKAAQWAHAVRLLREMAVQGLTPDVVSYGAAIDACRKAGKYDRGLALLSEMKDVGLAPNEVCYHSAVTACSEAGRWSEALLVLSEMVKQGLKPDAISYNAAVEACAKAGKWDALVLLIQDIGREQGIGNLAGAGGVSDDGSPTGIEGLSFTLAGAASGAPGQGGEGGEGGPLTSSSSSSGLPSDATTLVEAVLNNGVATCAKYGNWELASTLLHEMEYRGLPPTSASYSAVIDACARAHAWDLILSVFDALRTKQGLIPEASSYNAALKACCAKTMWKKAAQLLDEMATRGYTIDTHIYKIVSAKIKAGAEAKELSAAASTTASVLDASGASHDSVLGDPVLGPAGTIPNRFTMAALAKASTAQPEAQGRWDILERMAHQAMAQQQQQQQGPAPSPTQSRPPALRLPRTPSTEALFGPNSPVYPLGLSSVATTATGRATPSHASPRISPPASLGTSPLRAAAAAAGAATGVGGLVPSTSSGSLTGRLPSPIGSPRQAPVGSPVHKPRQLSIVDSNSSTASTTSNDSPKEGHHQQQHGSDVNELTPERSTGEGLTDGEHSGAEDGNGTPGTPASYFSHFEWFKP